MVRLLTTQIQSKTQTYYFERGENIHIYCQKEYCEELFFTSNDYQSPMEKN